MKNVVLIFSVIVSLLYLIVSQFVYPLIASFFDWYPIYEAFIIVLVLSVLSVTLTCLITKEKSIRLRILIPLVVAFLVSVCITYIRFGNNSLSNPGCYRHGYMLISNDLYNSLGVRLVSNSISRYWYKGVDKNGNEVLVNIDYMQDDCKYESEKKYVYEIRFYSLSGSFLHTEEITKYYHKRDYVYTPGFFSDAKTLLKSELDITLLEPFGWSL